ncbi:MAG: DUF1858 domain-containing protein [Trueperaceae bacterium]|nr:DUF1858 domain-containing protein [Trueperaceae bacterium]
MPRADHLPHPILDRRVSDLLAAAPGVLERLVEAGFAPLANPAARAVLAPTVTLRQAIALRGLDAARADALLAGLTLVFREDAACRA